MEKPKIESLRIKRLDDDSPDLSMLGEYGDTPRVGAIFRENAGRGEFRYWYPGPNHFPHDPKNWAHVKGEARKKVIQEYGSVKKAAAAYVRQDFERMEAYGHTWSMVGVVAEATVSYSEGQGVRRSETFTSGGLWGIESDSGDYFKEVEREELDDLKSHLEAFGVDTSNFEDLAEVAHVRRQ